MGHCIGRLIESGAIAGGSKLPTIRILSDTLSLSRVTVVSAYKYLENKRLVYSIGGSGTFAAELELASAPFSGQTGGDMLERTRMLGKFREAAGADFVNFAKSSVSHELFPVEEFKSAFNEVLERDRGRAFGYEDVCGYAPLREALAGYLAGCNISASADCVHIISGAQQGVDLIAKISLERGDCVFVEKPTYYGAVGAFSARGARLFDIPMEPDGMDLDILSAAVKLYKPKLLYTMPYFQTPTCVSASLAKKRRLIELAIKYDFLIVEEDNQCEFNFSDEDIIPLKALDYKNRVIYIKSFSKILMPGLRLGLLLLPPALTDAVKSVRYTTDIETSGFIQRAFDLFIRNGGFYRHIEKMRLIFRGRADAMREASRGHLSGMESADPAGGLNRWYKLPGGLSAERFCEALAQSGVIAYPGSLFTRDGGGSPYIRLSYADLRPEDIERGARVIGRVLKSSL